MLKRFVLALVVGIVFGGSAFAASVKNPVAEIKTSEGSITIELFQKEAPLSVANFIDYAKSGFYEGTIFHRVIQGFMIQGGGMNEYMQQKKGNRPIKNEAGNGLKNDRGTVAMARTGVVDSATSQFYINVVDNPFLNHKDDTPRNYGYAVFGKVIDGMDVVDKIAATPTGRQPGYSDVPLNPIFIKSVTIHQ